MDKLLHLDPADLVLFLALALTCHVTFHMTKSGEVTLFHSHPLSVLSIEIVNSSGDRVFLLPYVSTVPSPMGFQS